ncbi:hypothetical protein [Clostridium baratii]|uniref:hypothetical protein n=1 Tax=Clostridium baratii TaxID=1561 RepID=UPI0005F277B5|nr:hypothetical protein [Clostridium baratii]KJU71537.1 hypothetical protein UC77_08970 [Clostridium baratii]
MKAFLDNDEKLNLFKEWGLVKGNTTQIKELFYNKNDKFIRCDVIGYYRKLLILNVYQNIMIH